MALVLALASLFWLVATAVSVGGQAAVTTAREQDVPAYVSARAARAALSDADRAAWQSFRSGAAKLIGPGQRFRDDLTTAGQSLARVAGTDRGGATGRDLLHAVNAQVVTYQGLVEQADATYRQGMEKLGFAYLTYASDLLHGDGGLLARIDEIARRDRQAVEDQRDSAWIGSGVVIAPVAVGVVLMAALVYAQVAMARRFRRVLNLPLLAACVVLSVLVVWTTVTLVQTQRAFTHAHDTELPALDRVWQTQIAMADAGAGALRTGRSADLTGGLNVAAADRARRPLTTRLTDAADTGGLTWGLPLLSLAVAGLAAAGFALRLREYRG
ncbi:hypothetical protein [Actinomadura rugatobispora]|uniref:Secreted protein n=1 Tax=Actinomadura rugatobispora TaxID=1994 RepID=A0ABW1AEF5_9ACTN|nr:hypothetical protein GCM10010200_033790 [Actinomadura rugatobispora]